MIKWTTVNSENEESYRSFRSLAEIAAMWNQRACELPGSDEEVLSLTINDLPVSVPNNKAGYPDFITMLRVLGVEPSVA